jgi:gliding motility-associated-like protein
MDYIAEPITVEVTAIDEHGCRYHGETEIKIWKDIKAPTGFTPNNDGLNDVFQFYGLDNIETFDFYIYNRLGEVVFEGTSVDDTWDGTYQGQPCPWGVYGWVAHYTANVEGELREDTIKGHVSIVK